MCVGMVLLKNQRRGTMHIPFGLDRCPSIRNSSAALPLMPLMSNCFALDSANRCLPQRIGTAGTQPRPFALQSACLFDGGTQCIDDGATECAFFQNLKAADGGSGRRAHLVLQLARMLARFQHQPRRTQNRLRGNLLGLRALQPFGHAGVAAFAYYQRK